MTVSNEEITKNSSLSYDYSSKRDNAWITTNSGRKFWPLSPRHEDFHIPDIAHALSNQCRWTGHVDHHYSIAQHSCLAHDFVDDDSLKFPSLMHDATEFALSDISRPMKPHINGYIEIESALDKAIQHRYDYSLSAEEKSVIKKIDNDLLVLESRCLIKHASKEFAGYDVTALVKKIKEARTLKEKVTDFFMTLFGIEPPIIRKWSPERAKKEFLKRFKQHRAN